MTDNSKPSVLLVEDDESIATIIQAALRDAGFRTTRAASIAARNEALADATFDVVLTDVILPDGDGIESLPGTVIADTPVVVVSAQNTLDTAVRASEIEAFEYFPKPFDIDELVEAVRQAASKRAPGKTDRNADDGMPLVGRSPAMQAVYRLITRVLRNDLTVIITGESGTGKELVAEAIHELGHRKTGPFVAVNTGAIPRDLVESELFGHERGAFTGAVSQSIGKFEQANGGTLFLDEIGDMPPEAQTRLLRVLQSGRVRRVGGKHEIPVDVRIIAATNRDLMPMIDSGEFREDLFYRLNVVPIRLPALRERKSDIEQLAHHFLVEAQEEGLPRRELDSDAIAFLSEKEWRGNVRELRNTMFRAALLSREETISVAILRETGEPEGSVSRAGTDEDLGSALARWLREQSPVPGRVYQEALAAFEAPLISHALILSEGNQLRAAEWLGINRNTLRKRLTDLRLDPDGFASGAESRKA
ncbi:sigma-54 dependent transcriptional regulator [Qipengyuania sp. JC766]|uniref:sigma-54-dependent transcriptional regulator n=1 Tax=Qipengyuania sp. JC766 TaxID=3232139 RepID=UPI003459CF88